MRGLLLLTALLGSLWQVPAAFVTSYANQNKKEREKRVVVGPETTKLYQSTNKEQPSSEDTLHVVLFGVGDLRTDDHEGLQKAAKAGQSILPLCLLNDDSLANIPGGIAHTFDTAQLVSQALTDLDESLKRIGLNLHVQMTTDNQSMSETLSSVVNQVASDSIVRVHACDLGHADNQLGYGPYAHFLKEDLLDDRLEIVPWKQDLRSEPWKEVEKLPTDYPTYELEYAVNPPKEPLPIPTQQAVAQSTVASIKELQTIPTADELKERLMKIHQLDPKRCKAEQRTGLFATHWGGLDAKSIGGSAVLRKLRTYVEECAENDEVWSTHPRYTLRGCRTNGRSLEHASMNWQLKGDGRSPTGRPENWMAGESMVRYLAAPLLLGTVSPRRIWHASKYEGTFFYSPLKRLVESREWHQLLAAHNIETNPAYQGEGKTTYKYWRYHGFLCRYAVTDFEPESRSDEKEGLLLIHGFGASGAQWNKAMNEFSALTESTCEGLAPDLLGFGQSEKPAISYTGYLWDSQILELAKERAIAVHGWDSFVTGGNSIGGFSSMSVAASDTALIESRTVSSNGAPGTGRCTGLVLMNSAGPVKTKDEVIAERTKMVDELQFESVAQVTALKALPECKPPSRPLARTFGNVLLSYLRPRIQPICTNLYPTNPSAVDDELCDAILRDSLDPGAINVMMAGAKLPVPRTANELLSADFGASMKKADAVQEAVFNGPVLIAQGVLDPLNDAMDRMNRFGALRKGISVDPIQAGHCPHDELPDKVASSIASWMATTKTERMARINPKSSAPSADWIFS